MTDKELLELAAKAAGIELKINKVTPCYHGEPNFESLRRTHSLGRKSDWIVWNPLTDDGDALRLAVKLNLDITHSWSIVNGDDNYPMASVHVSRNGENFIYELKESDPYAATRRAVVRAAAEIGKNV